MTGQVVGRRHQPGLVAFAGYLQPPALVPLGIAGRRTSLGPAGLPAYIVNSLATLVRQSVTESEAVSNVREQLGSQDTPLIGEALQRFIGRRWSTYQAMTRTVGLKME